MSHLESAFAVKQRLGVRISPHSNVEGIEDELVVIAPANREGHNIPALEVENGSEIQLLTITILHFGHVGEPLLVGFLGGESSAQDIFCRYLRRGSLVCWSFTPNDRLQSHKLRQPVKPFVVVSGAVALPVSSCRMAEASSTCRTNSASLRFTKPLASRMASKTSSHRTTVRM